MSREEFIKTYWRYYLILEQRVQKIERYVEFVKDNRETYSVEFIGCLMEIGSEIDVVMKNICNFSEKDRSTIKEYAPLILEKYKGIKEQEVRIRGIAIKPFEKWSVDEPANSLEWWKAYNSVKHGRSENYQMANLTNVIYSLAALFLIEMHRIKELAQVDVEPDIPEKMSELFEAVQLETKWIEGNSDYFCRVETI